MVAAVDHTITAVQAMEAHFLLDFWPQSVASTVHTALTAHMAMDTVAKAMVESMQQLLLVRLLAVSVLCK